jgi:hypothetical protein
MPLSQPGGALPEDTLGATLDSAPVPRSVQVKTPTKFGRFAELATGGAYDPTGGEDTTKPPMAGWGSSNPTPRLTKFGALAKIMGSALEGAAVGGFMGRSHPGGGFGAANDYFQQQRLRQMQFAQFLQQQQLNQSTIAKNQAEAQWAQRRPLVTRTGQ